MGLDALRYHGNESSKKERLDRQTDSSPTARGEILPADTLSD